MATQSGWSFDRDAAGNRLNRLDAAAYGKLSRYGEHNRLSQVSDRDVRGDTVAATYTYDGRGQRVSKTAGGMTTHFVYGLNGELLGEINTDGSARIEYVYFNGQPIAVYSKLAKTEKRRFTEKGKTINNFLEKITEDLEKSDNYLFKIESINKTLSVLK